MRSIVFKPIMHAVIIKLTTAALLLLALAACYVDGDPIEDKIITFKPIVLSVIGVDQGVDISWNVVSGATSYTVYYHTASFNQTFDSGVESKTAITSTNTSITGLTNGTKYYLRVESINANNGDKGLSEEVTAIANLRAPTKLKATGKDKAIEISWRAVKGAASYNVYYHTASFSSTAGVQVKTVESSTLSTSITGLTDGTKYYLRVEVINADGDKKLSKLVTTTTKATVPAKLSAPTNLQATGGDKIVYISWNAVTGAIIYRVYYHTASFSSTAGVQVKTVESSTLSTSITGLTDGTKYYLRVEVINADGDKKLSKIVTTTTKATVPANLSAPTNLQATGVSQAIAISWDAVADATGYTVYYHTASFSSTTDSGVQSKTGITTTNAIITDLTNDTRYYLRVEVINAKGETKLSEQVTAVALRLSLVPHPSAAASINSPAAVDLSWDALAGVTGYKIYYAKDSLDGLNGGYKNYVSVGGKLEVITDTSATIGDLSADTTYYFVVAANYKVGEAAAPEVSAKTSYIAELAIGDFHGCVRLNTGSIKCWGGNRYGQLGLGDKTNRKTATSVPGMLAKQLSAGRYHSCAIDLKDRLYCWGYSGFDRPWLSDAHRLRPTLVTQDNLANLSLVRAGQTSTCALADGNNYCWGRQGSGGLGNGVSSSTPANTAQEIRNITSDVKQFALGYLSGCAIDVSEDLWCWGNNWYGQVGDGTYTHQPSPVKPKLQGSSSKATMLAGRNDHYCVVDNAKKIQCWGRNKRGQLGIDSTADSNRPQYVLASPKKSDYLTGVSKIAAGWRNSCAIITGGSVRCWGYSDDGIIGDTTADRLIADTDILGINNAIDIVVGAEYTCVLLADRARVKCWGANHYGQLGNGIATTKDSHTPSAVKGL